MNQNRILNLGLQGILLCFLVVLGACSENEIIEQEYLRVSVNSYTFNAQVAEPITIQIDSHADWTVDYSENSEWLQEVDKGADYLTLSATANTSPTARKAQVRIFSAGQQTFIEVDQLEDYSYTGYKLIKSSLLTQPSFNGKYLATFAYEQGAFWLRCINTETGELEVNEPCDVDPSGFKLLGVTDEGTVLIYMDYPNTLYELKEGKLVEKFDFSAHFAGVTLTGFSADGSVVVGLGVKGWSGVPFKLNKGELEELPNPETNLVGGYYGERYALALGCSADGSIVYGCTPLDKIALYWKDGKMHYIGQELAKETEIKTVEYGETYIDPYMNGLRNDNATFGISPNGKYLAVTYGVAINQQEHFIPAVYNMETAEVKLIEVPLQTKTGAKTTYVSNEGDVFYGFPVDHHIVNSLVVPAGSPKSISLTSYLIETFNMIYTEDTGSVRMMSESGNMIYGLNLDLSMGQAIPAPWYVLNE